MSAQSSICNSATFLGAEPVRGKHSSPFPRPGLRPPAIQLQFICDAGGGSQVGPGDGVLVYVNNVIVPVRNAIMRVEKKNVIVPVKNVIAFGFSEAFT